MFEYRITEKRPGQAELVSYMQVQIVKGDMVYIDRGDEDGIRERVRQTGEPRFGVVGACLPQYLLIRGDAKECWHRLESNPGAGRLKTASFPLYVDPRLVGIAPWPKENKSFDENLKELENTPFSRWVVDKDGGLLIVCGWFDEGDKPRYGYEWRLDSEKDMAIIEVAIVRPAGGRRSVVARHEDYARIDGRWWPKRVWRSLGEGGYRIVEFRKVEFDRKEHPTKLTLEHMGLPVGGHVRVVGGDPEKDFRYVGGDRYVSAEEFERLKPELDLGPYEAFRHRLKVQGTGQYPTWWNDADGALGTDGVERKPDAWEIYVRRWKIRHGPKTELPLSEAQHKSADAILKSCRQRAQNILDKHKDVAEREVAETKLARILDDLKLRLNRLLTTPQTERDKVEVSAAGKQ